MTGLKWEIPKAVLYDTARILASKDLEVFVMWAAPLEIINNTHHISRLIVPEQDSHSELGREYVHIHGKELSRVVFDNYRRLEKSVVQIHTHPSVSVEMSLLDREWEVVRDRGALSIIVPNHGKNGLDGFPGVNIYEKEADDWRLWNKDEFLSRFVIV